MKTSVTTHEIKDYFSSKMLTLLWMNRRAGIRYIFVVHVHNNLRQKLNKVLLIYFCDLISIIGKKFFKLPVTKMVS